MRDTARQLAERLHLLGLPKLFLRAATFGNYRFQLPIGVDQRLRLFFQRIVGAAQRHLTLAPNIQDQWRHHSAVRSPNLMVKSAQQPIYLTGYFDLLELNSILSMSYTYMTS